VLVNLTVADVVPFRERGLYMGLISLSGAVGLITGAVLGSGLGKSSTWRLIFAVNLPICIPTFFGIYIFLRTAQPLRGFFSHINEFDWLGLSTLCLSLLSLLYGLTSGGIVYEWTSPTILLPCCLESVAVSFSSLLKGLRQKTLRYLCAFSRVGPQPRGFSHPSSMELSFGRSDTI